MDIFRMQWGTNYTSLKPWWLWSQTAPENPLTFTLLQGSLHFSSLRIGVIQVTFLALVLRRILKDIPTNTTNIPKNPKVNGKTQHANSTCLNLILFHKFWGGRAWSARRQRTASMSEAYTLYIEDSTNQKLSASLHILLLYDLNFKTWFHLFI